MKSNKIANLDESIGRNITVYTNTDDGLIRIMETKLENILLKHKQAIQAGSDWKTPLGLFIAVSAFFGVGDFNRDFLGISKNYWGAGFLIVLIISVIWFFKSIVLIFRNRNENIDTLMSKIKSNERRL